MILTCYLLSSKNPFPSPRTIKREWAPCYGLWSRSYPVINTFDKTKELILLKDYILLEIQITFLFRYLDILTTPFSHTTDILSSTPFTPLGILVKSSFPRAFWHMSKVQLSVAVTDRSALWRNKVHYELDHVPDMQENLLGRSSHPFCKKKTVNTM